MEGAKAEEKSDVYSTNMTEARGAGKYADYVKFNVWTQRQVANGPMVSVHLCNT